MIKSYRSHDSRVPNKILNKKDKNSKLACITSFIVDECYVRDIIIFYSSNELLLSQIRQLVLDCDYNCSEIKFDKKSGSYIFALKNEDIKKFYNDLQELSKKFPTCNLSFKEDDVRFIINRRDKKNARKNKDIDKIITDILRRGCFTTKQISRETSYAHCTILHHLENLYNKREIKRERGERGVYIWEL